MSHYTRSRIFCYVSCDSRILDHDRNHDILCFLCSKGAATMNAYAYAFATAGAFGWPQWTQLRVRLTLVFLVAIVMLMFNIEMDRLIEQRRGQTQPQPRPLCPQTRPLWHRITIAHFIGACCVHLRNERKSVCLSTGGNDD
jgi:hypothetical protein